MKTLRVPSKFGTQINLCLKPYPYLGLMLNGRYRSLWWKDDKFHTYRFDNIWRKNGTPLPRS